MILFLIKQIDFKRFFFMKNRSYLNLFLNRSYLNLFLFASYKHVCLKHYSYPLLKCMYIKLIIFLAKLFFYRENI